MSNLPQKYLSEARRIFKEAIVRDERINYYEYLRSQVINDDSSSPSDTPTSLIDIEPKKLLRKLVI